MKIPTPPPTGTQEQRHLARQLILHICRRLETSPTFASTVLAKVLYYIDREFYLSTGQQLTYFTYVKQKNGPTPAPAQFLPLREQMIDAEELELRVVQYFGKAQKKPLAKIAPDLSLPDSGVTRVNEVIDSFRFSDAATASELSHNLPWEVAELMEELPAFTFLATESDELDDDDIQWGMKTIEEYKSAA